MDAELQAHGGAARFIMDDGYAVGPAAVVFPALRRFGEVQTGPDTCEMWWGCLHKNVEPDRRVRGLLPAEAGSGRVARPLPASENLGTGMRRRLGCMAGYMLVCPAGAVPCFLVSQVSFSPTFLVGSA